MIYEISWKDGHTEEIDAESAFLKLSGFKGENVARMMLDETRQKGSKWPFGVGSTEIGILCFKR